MVDKGHMRVSSYTPSEVSDSPTGTSGQSNMTTQKSMMSATQTSSATGNQDTSRGPHPRNAHESPVRRK